MDAKVTEYCVNIRDKILTFEDVSFDESLDKHARSSKESSGLEKENSMNALWLSNIEILAEEERADFRREMEKYRLGREALSTKPRRPSWIVRRMQDLSVWMVTTGERLHRRYYDTDPIPRWYQSFKVAR